MSELDYLPANLGKNANARLASKPVGSVALLDCRPQDVPGAAGALARGGAFFDSAFIMRSRRPASFAVFYLFRLPSMRKMLAISAQGRKFFSITGSVSAAEWDERKMRDLSGCPFEGLEDSRPLIFHPEAGMPGNPPLAYRSSKPDAGAIAGYSMPGTGEEGEFEIAVGPVHAGIIEPGHFRFHVVGERINKMEARMFFLHRGIEKLAQGKTVDEGVAVAEMVSGDECVANAVAYCQAVESLASISVPLRAQFIRVMLLEIERIYSHLSDLGGMATDVGFSQSSSRFMLLREEMMRLNGAIAGDRFLKGMVAVGGTERDFGPSELSTVFAQVQKFNAGFMEIKDLTLSSSTFLDRAFSTGVLSREHASKLCAVGPVARASEISCDSRIWLPYSAYGRLRVYEPTGEYGDVLSRFYVKADEVMESVGIVLAAASSLRKLGGPIRAKNPAPASFRNGLGFGVAEAPRGSCTFMVATDGKGNIARFACRTASFRNWKAIEKAVETIIMPDFPLVNKSFNLSYAGNDL